MFDYVLNGTCVISLQFSRVEFTANHEFVPATFHCERKNKSSVILKPVSCVMFPISYSENSTLRKLLSYGVLLLRSCSAVAAIHPFLMLLDTALLCVNFSAILHAA